MQPEVSHEPEPESKADSASILRRQLDSAWIDGWNQRGRLSNAPLGTRNAEKSRLRAKYLDAKFAAALDAKASNQ